MYADKPVESAVRREPDLGLIPCNVPGIWKGRNFVGDADNVGWHIFDAAGEEKEEL